MHCMKSFTFCSLLMMLTVGADILTNDETSHEMSAVSTTLTPIALQMAMQHIELKNQQSSENKNDYRTLSTPLQSKPEENNEILKEHDNNSDKKISLGKNNQYQTPNDVEVFKHKPGATMEKQEEEPEAEPEVEAEAVETAAEEETKGEEVEAEPAAEEEAKGEEVEAEPDPAAEEEPKEEKVEAEPEPAAEEEPKEDNPEPAAEEQPKEEEKAEADPEAQPEDTKNEETPANDEQEMSNDEPAKEEDQAPHESSDPPTNAKDNKELSCFSCTSVDDMKCHIKPTHQENCPKVNAGDSGKHNGCYTLYKADTNMTIRGCVDDLAEDGLKYCLTKDKFCLLCYTNGCNNKLAPNNAAIQQLNIYLMILMNGFSILVIKKSI